jgi:hypothetical protein
MRSGQLPGFRVGQYPDSQGPAGFCAHHYDTNFAALVLTDCEGITFERTNRAIQAPERRQPHTERKCEAPAELGNRSYPALIAAAGAGAPIGIPAVRWWNESRL